MPAPKNNRYAAKPPGTHKNTGRVHAYIGAGLKARCEQAAHGTRPPLTLTDWIKAKLARAADEDGFGEK